MEIQQKITPFLWFDGQAEEAARFYAAIFPDSAILDISRYTEAGFELHQQPPGTAMTVTFRLGGMLFTALNGTPAFPFTEAVSFAISCADQAEVDHYWDALSEGGDPAAQQCGWLKDRYGLSWQVVPEVLPALLGSDDPAANARATTALLGMKRLVIAELERAFRGA